MVSKGTALLIAKCYEQAFGKGIGVGFAIGAITGDDLHDFLYRNECDDYLVQEAVRSHKAGSLKQFILDLGRGTRRSVDIAGRKQEDRLRICQGWLEQLARGILVDSPRNIFGVTNINPYTFQLKSSLELDGYRLQNGQLSASELTVLDEAEAHQVLRQLACEVGLADAKMGFHHLDGSHTCYLAGKWEDSIGNSRKFLEYVVWETAAKCHLIDKGSPIDPKWHGLPRKARGYIQRVGLISLREKTAIDTLYALLSETGGHPYMAEREQARLMRHLALTLAQFVLLRLKGYKAAKT